MAKEENEGRLADGTFKKGHSLSCSRHGGRPPGDKALLERFKASLSTEDMDTITEKLVSKCKEGDLVAIKLLFSYLFGLPKQAVDIGILDLRDMYLKELPRVDEWFEQQTGDLGGFPSGSDADEWSKQQAGDAGRLPSGSDSEV